MAEAGALLYHVGKSGLGLIGIDAILSETPSASAEVTRHPIEGSSVSDHVLTAPRKVDVVVAVSDMPIARESSPEIPNASEGRSASTWQELIRIWKNKTLVRLVTGIEEFPHMVITNLSTRRDASFSSSLQIQISLEEVQLVHSARVAMPDEMQKPKDMGKQPTRPAEPAVANKAHQLDRQTTGAMGSTA